VLHAPSCYVPLQDSKAAICLLVIKAVRLVAALGGAGSLGLSLVLCGRNLGFLGDGLVLRLGGCVRNGDCDRADFVACADGANGRR
jgi:hypothetical protein